MSGKPELSVVVATFRRRRTLETTLQRLADQTMPSGRYEVIVVDDGSDDGTGEMVESFTRRAPYSLRYYVHANRGPGYSQNRGIREAAGEITLLLPDDIWATRELLSEHMRSHELNPEENVAVLGKVSQSLELPKTVMSRHWDPFQFYRFAGKKVIDAINFLACNVSVKKKFLLENGLFKERKGAAHEDIELGYRLREKGLKLLYNENAMAYHHHEETLAGACRRAYERGLNYDTLSESIPKPFILPLYHILTPEVGFANFVKMLPRELIRALLFNRITVNGFWIPALDLAERSRIAAVFASGVAYRGVVGFFQREGYRDLRRGIVNKVTGGTRV